MFTIKYFQNSKSGFTLIELLIIIGILVVLISQALPAFRSFQRESDLTNDSESIISALRMAQSKALASEENSPWGVYFSTSSNQYILFKGSDYSSRDPVFDKTGQIADDVEIYSIVLNGSGQEVIFNKILGDTSQTGQISLRLENDITKIKIITISSSGQVAAGLESSPADTSRIKDSRHVHFDYTRFIDTLNETLTLTFYYNGSTVTQDILLADYIEAGNILWQGTVNVDGQEQQLKIQTHYLNDPLLNTQFSIHRDGRYNNRALKIEISGDSSGDLLQYSADGLNTQGTSIYASEFCWE